MDAPADTFGYMAFGFIVIFGTIALYIGYLKRRKDTVASELEMVEELESERAMPAETGSSPAAAS